MELVKLTQLSFSGRNILAKVPISVFPHEGSAMINNRYFVNFLCLSVALICCPLIRIMNENTSNRLERVDNKLEHLTLLEWNVSPLKALLIPLSERKGGQCSWGLS